MTRPKVGAIKAPRVGLDIARASNEVSTALQDSRLEWCSARTTTLTICARQDKFTAMRITEAVAKKSEPSSKLWDDRIVGFSLWVSPKGKKTFYAQKSIRNQTRRKKIGEWPAMTVQEARRKARETIASWDGETRTEAFADFTTEELVLELLNRVRTKASGSVSLRRNDSKPP